MLHEIKQWQQKLEKGWLLGESFIRKQPLPVPLPSQKIVFVGLGGSGIPGTIFKTFLDRQPHLLSWVIDSPDVPAAIGPDCRALVMSYSGNTWETIAACKVLHARQVPMIIISYGGILREIALKENIPFIQLPECSAPRAALGYFLGLLCSLAQAASWLEGKALFDAWVEHCELFGSGYENKEQYQEFLRIAHHRSFFHLWGVRGDSAAVAYRAQTQFNENSKVQSIAAIFPELCHNLMVGFTKSVDTPLIVLMMTDYLSLQLRQGLQAATTVLEHHNVALYAVPMQGHSWEGQLLHCIIWADFASYYLGLARGVEVAPVTIIDELKATYKKIAE